MSPEVDRACRAVRGPWAGTPHHFDAPFVPTPDDVVERMLDLAGVGPGDRLVDLGCGDGRILIAAARRGAEALGIELDPERIAGAEANVRAAGMEDRVTFRCEDLFATRFEEASVVTLFLLGLPNNLLAPRLRTELAQGSRVVSYRFDMRDWEPTVRDDFDGRALFLWVVGERPGPAPLPLPLAGEGRGEGPR